MAVIIGSARSDEYGRITGGAAGDQKGGAEVSTQNFYVHSKGWYVVRAKSDTHANKIAERMRAACANNNIGYDQTGRLGVINNGIDTKTKTECDCSSLVRACVKEATGKDPGNFITSNEVALLQGTGLFMATKTYYSGMTLYTGDILVTKTKGHTVIVTSGASRGSSSPASKPTTTQKSASSTPSSSNKISVDGEWGKATTRAAQRVFSTTIDGIVSKQIAKYKKYMPNCLTSSWQFKTSGYHGGSQLIKAIQKWCGAEQDGLVGPSTIKKFQRKLGVKADGYIGGQTVTAFQKYLNKYL